MKIALVSPYDYPYPGGVTKHITNLAESFRRRGHQVRVIAASSRSPQDLPADVMCVSSFVVPVPYSGSVARISFSPRLPRRVRALLRQEAFDVVHIHEPTTPALPWAVAVETRKRSPGSALIGTFHAYREMPSFPYRCARPILRHLINRLDERIAVSAASSDYISAYFPGSYQLIPNGVDAALFGCRDLSPLPEFADGLNILFVGRLEPRKGFCYLLEAYARLKPALPGARLLVVGPYTAEDRLPFERELGRLRLADVHFVGYVPDAELARYYQSSHLLCAPSTGFESFGMVLLEAMAAGTPVVASDIEGYRHVVTPGAEGLLVPPRDPAALADALIYLLRSPSLRMDMGRRGRATAAGYTWDTVADRILDCYGDTLDRKREVDKVRGLQIAPRGLSPYGDSATLSTCSKTTSRF
jgi:phosphatidylinositol alpha-mannosyltransferase